MPYCNLDDLKKAISEKDIIQLTDDKRSGIVDTGIVDEKIAKAGTLIDSYVGGRYTLPLSPAPDLIADIAVDLTVYFLYERRFRANMPESIMKIYSATIKKLEGIQKGELQVPGATESGGSLETGTGEIRSNKTADDRIFSKDVMDRY